MVLWSAGSLVGICDSPDTHYRVCSGNLYAVGLRSANNARTASGWCSLLGSCDGAPAPSPQRSPPKGLYEAADLHWWWRTPRSTDNLRQLFWFDHLGRPEAAVIATDWGDPIALDPIVMPDATPDWVAHVIERGLAHASESGFGAVELEVDRADDVMREVLVGHGFAIKEDGAVETWLAADARPEISPLHEDYRLSSRLDTMLRPHHMIKRSGPGVEQRLLQTSLYRSDLDLLIVDLDDNNADRHLLTSGIDLLAEAGAVRIKICFEPDNPAARGLYLSVGFEPVKQTDVLSRQASARAS